MPVPAPILVMAGLVPAIHVFFAAKTWMPGTRPGMTAEEIARISLAAFSARP